jgi:hypothetical protein
VDSSNILGIIVNHVITLVIFGFGFYLLHTIGSSLIYQQMTRGEGPKGQPLLRLKSQPTIPSYKFGLNYTTLDVAGMIFATLLVFVVTVVLQGSGGIPLGGFVGGWLIGNAANQVRFASKIIEEQTEQGRLFYFSDPGIGPRTQISYFQVDPTKDHNKVAIEETENRLNQLTNTTKPTPARRSARIAKPLIQSTPNPNPTKNIEEE